MVDVPASPDSVWKTIGDFCGIANWHPAIEKCEISKKDGATFRTLTLKGGGTILEKQTNWDNKAKTYSYTIEESPLPVANYKATLSVTPKGSGSEIMWISNFNRKARTTQRRHQQSEASSMPGLPASQQRRSERSHFSPMLRSELCESVSAFDGIRSGYALSRSLLEVSDRLQNIGDPVMIALTGATNRR